MLIQNVKIVDVVDGDSLLIQGERQTLDSIRVDLDLYRGASIPVRLYGVDAVELNQSSFGWKAKRRVEDLLNPYSMVDLKVYAADQYLRLLADVYAEGESLNKQLLAEGFVVVYPHTIDDPQLEQDYYEAQRIAQKGSLGFWGIPNIEFPWDYRRRLKKEGRWRR